MKPDIVTKMKQIGPNIKKSIPITGLSQMSDIMELKLLFYINFTICERIPFPVRSLKIFSVISQLLRKNYVTRKNMNSFTRCVRFCGKPSILCSGDQMSSNPTFLKCLWSGDEKVSLQTKKMHKNSRKFLKNNTVIYPSTSRTPEYH